MPPAFGVLELNDLLFFNCDLTPRWFDHPGLGLEIPCPGKPSVPG